MAYRFAQFCMKSLEEAICRQGLGGAQRRPWAGTQTAAFGQGLIRALSLARTRAPHGGPWSVRTMASETGLSKSSVQRLWSAHKLQPHRVRHFKLSKDLQFEEKLWDCGGPLPRSARSSFGALL
jgi:hypothetical protein